MFFISKCLKIGKSNKFSFSRCFCLQHTVPLTEEQVRLKAVQLAELLDCSLQTATAIIGRNTRILSLDDIDFEKAAKFCKNNLRFSDVTEYPNVFSLHHYVLNRRLHALKELGCYDGVRSIVKFSTIMNGNSKTILNKRLPYTQEFLHKIFTDCSADKVENIAEKLSEMYNTNGSIFDIKIELCSQYLSCQLKFSDEKIQKMRKKLPTVFMQSIEDVSLSVKLLMEKYGLSLSAIRQCPSLLTLHSNHLEKYQESVPSILGVPLKTLIKKCPIILQKTPAALKKLEMVLQDYGVKECQVMSCPKIITVNHTTVQYRLQVLHKTEEFVLFKAFRNFLWLVVNFKNCHSRLKTVKESGLPYSLGIFTLSDPMFKNRILFNKSVTYIKDTTTYLADFYNIDEKAMRKRISKLPNIYGTSCVDVHKVVSFLVSHGVSKEQLWNGLGIIVYEPEIVTKLFNELPYYKEFQPFSEWQGHFNLIQLLIYAIERNRNDLISKNKCSIFNIQENMLSIANEDDSDDIFKEFEVDSFSDIEEEEDAEDGSDSEEEKITDVHKL